MNWKRKKIKESIILCEGDFFKEYLYNFRNYLLTIKTTFLKDFTKIKLDNKEDKKFFQKLYVLYYKL